MQLLIQTFKVHDVSECGHSPFLHTVPLKVFHLNHLQIQAKLKPHRELYPSLTTFSPTSNPRREVYADVRYDFSELKTHLEFF